MATNVECVSMSWNYHEIKLSVKFGVCEFEWWMWSHVVCQVLQIGWCPWQYICPPIDLQSHWYEAVLGSLGDHTAPKVQAWCRDICINTFYWCPGVIWKIDAFSLLGLLCSMWHWDLEICAVILSFCCDVWGSKFNVKNYFINYCESFVYISWVEE